MTRQCGFFILQYLAMFLVWERPCVNIMTVEARICQICDSKFPAPVIDK